MRERSKFSGDAHLLGSGCSIVFTSSVVANTVVPNLAAYAATRGAIDTLVKHLAAALGGRGIRVNAVAPGIIDTDMSHFARTEEGQAYIFRIQALHRIGQTDDVGGVFAFLASDAARWVTGDTVRVDGGSKL
ncbi:SDR family oxidoreductase [Methylobacterium trifolii]|uniref:3-oxoacyl-[acyl-carrier-protein] reductase FabG n=1 Tax=Methylobacterium trifolii TaxID=1003092 RepID=A0ABQ4U2B7_9HYPH|nr:SDR family oxidoreductase [Methylobacterium trifolii]GJE60979.1 3-oxoacyl-[acyl-carrier-protein] reductase FabG [Methylobacterium trifolii]